MKKTLIASLLAVASLAQAHELWVNVPAKAAADEVLKAEMGYGHEFPAAEPIAADRLHIFKPLQITALGGKAEDMNQQGENYQYVSKDKIGKGVYWVSAIYQPTFWSKNDSGWKQQSLKEMPDASTCQQAQMFGKALVVVGDEKVDAAAVGKPLGLGLEIVPLADPTQIKADALFPLQVYYDGKPLTPSPKKTWTRCTTNASRRRFPSRPTKKARPTSSRSSKACGRSRSATRRRLKTRRPAWSTASPARWYCRLAKNAPRRTNTTKAITTTKRVPHENARFMRAFLMMGVSKRAAADDEAVRRVGLAPPPTLPGWCAEAHPMAGSACRVWRRS